MRAEKNNFDLSLIFSKFFMFSNLKVRKILKSENFVISCETLVTLFLKLQDISKICSPISVYRMLCMLNNTFLVLGVGGDDND